MLYNNVGVSRTGLIGELSDADWRFQQRLTLDTVFYATRAVLPHMERQGAGSIVSMSSGAGIAGEYALGAYAAAKAGVMALTRCAAIEAAPHGVRVNSVHPGAVATTTGTTGERAAEALARLESTFKPGRYKLTFVARYVGPDGLDADVIVSADDTAEVVAVLEKHRQTKAEAL